jgi:hypothetical protein
VAEVTEAAVSRHNGGPLRNQEFGDGCLTSMGNEALRETGEFHWPSVEKLESLTEFGW